MKNRILILITLSCLTFFPGMGQELIGQSADSVRSLVKLNFPGFTENTTSINNVYKYLKFEDQEGLQTLLVFLSDTDTCKFYKRICDYELLKFMITSLDNKYEKADSLWSYNIGERYFRKELKKKDWFFTITTRPYTKNEPQKEVKNKDIL